MPAALYIGGWLLMIAAMMLPTVIPLLRRFDRLVAARPDRGRLLALLIAGYLLAWLGFGVAAHLLDAGLREAALRSDWLLFNGWIVGSVILAGAGLFQFTRLKYHCLDTLPHAAELYRQALARARAAAQRPAARPRPRRLLRRVLLGDHAADVCRRHRAASAGCCCSAR